MKRTYRHLLLAASVLAVLLGCGQSENHWNRAAVLFALAVFGFLCAHRLHEEG